MKDEKQQMGEVTNKSVCIVIPTFNRVSYLRQLLKQISVQLNTDGMRILPLVVVDGSSDGTAEMLKAEFPSVHVLQGTGGWWWTKSVNEGMKYACAQLKPDYFLLLNDDSQIQPDFLDAMMDAAEEAGEDALIGSLSVTDTAPYQVSFSGVKTMNWKVLKKQNYYKPFELLEKLPPRGLFPTYALNGRGTFATSKLMQELGFLDEQAFPQYGSDDDLALRAWKRGLRVLIAYNCKVYDRTGDTSRGSALRQDGLGVFVSSFFIWNSVNYIPKQVRFFYRHGIKVFLPFYLFKFLGGTTYAWLFKYKKRKHEV